MTGEPRHPMYSDGKDAERLADAANAFANGITLRELGAHEINNSDTVLDIGAGSDLKLGEAIAVHGADYVVLDIDPVFIDKHARAGRPALLASAEEIPLADQTVSIINARFNFGWLGESGRSKTWDEIVRVATPGFKGVITDFDWLAVTGPEDYMILVQQMIDGLKSVGFEPDYGARSYADIEQALAARLGGNNYHVTETRDQLPLTDPQHKMKLVQGAVENAIAGLRQDADNKANQKDYIAAAAQAQLADKIEHQLALVSTLDAGDFGLPDIVSVRFEHTFDANGSRPKIKAPYIGKTLLSGTLPALPHHAQGVHMPRVIRVGLEAQDSVTGLEARQLHAKRYRERDLILPGGFNSDGTLNEAHDPAEVRRRSEIFAALDSDKRVVGTARLVHPDGNGLESLPTAAKLIHEYGSTFLPADAQHAGIGEISGVASEGGPVVAIDLVTAVMRAARRANFKYLLFAAVDGSPNTIFQQLFGPAIHYVEADHKPLDVVVTGKNIPGKGTKLHAAYAFPDKFYETMLHYYQTNNSEYARHVIAMCGALNSGGQLAYE